MVQSLRAKDAGSAESVEPEFKRPPVKDRLSRSTFDLSDLTGAQSSHSARNDSGP